MGDPEYKIHGSILPCKEVVFVKRLGGLYKGDHEVV